MSTTHIILDCSPSSCQKLSVGGNLTKLYVLARVVFLLCRCQL